jgi:serine O-acetyltransferase
MLVKDKDLSEQEQLHQVVRQLSQPLAEDPICLQRMPPPNIQQLGKMNHLLRVILFPKYFGESALKPVTLANSIGAILDKVTKLLFNQIMRGVCFACSGKIPLKTCQSQAREKVRHFVTRLPQIRDLLEKDVYAAYMGDPAAQSTNEVIFCYPSIKALTTFRIAHELHVSRVPIIPRILTEMVHSETGIDIHPGAVIGESFFMDHGTGIVIGETVEIGKNVRIYQGVTLGAKSFLNDKNGSLVKGIPRHPIVEDDVIIYSGATILGRVTIGTGSIIGGNVWITANVPSHTRVIQTKPKAYLFENGGGI